MKLSSYLAVILGTLVFLPPLAVFAPIHPAAAAYLAAAWLTIACIIVIRTRSSVAGESGTAASRRNAALAEFTRKLGAECEPDDIPQALCECAGEHVGVEMAAACLIDPASGILRVRAVSVRDGNADPPEGLVSAPSTNGSILRSCLDSREVTECDRTDLGPWASWLASDGVERFVLIPLSSSALALGVLITGWRDAQAITGESIDSLQAAASVAALAICRSSALTSLDHRLQRVGPVRSIVGALRPEASPQEVKRALVDHGRSAMVTDMFALFTIDPCTGEMECESTTQVDEALQQAFLGLYGNQIADRERCAAWVVRNVAEECPAHRDERQVLLGKGVQSIFACPIRSDLNVSGAIAAFYRSSIWLPDEKAGILETLAGQASAVISYAHTIEQSRCLLDDLAGANQQLSEQATVDGLTELANHRTFQQTLAELCRRSAAAGRTFSLAMVDVDHFKVYNDMHGHQEGDAVLRRVAKTMSSSIRQGDVAARYGGEEFALIFLNAAKNDAVKAAERIRRSIAEQSYAKGTVTVSVGLAEFPSDGSTPAELIESADKALYHAKITGRNRVFAWGTAACRTPVEGDASHAVRTARTVLLVQSPAEPDAAAIGDALASLSCSVQHAADPAEATELLKTRGFDIALVSRHALPGGDLKSLSTLVAIHPHMPIVLVASNLPAKATCEAVRCGASDILLKPCNPAELSVVIERNLERRRLELQRLTHKGTGIMLQAIEALVAAVDAKDHYTAAHSQRVAALALAISDELQISDEERYALELAAKLHDIGKLALPDAALNKQSPLTEEEWQAAREHPVVGARIVGAIDELAYVGTIVRHHHECLDGTGYPDGLRGPAIPYLSRIIAVADAYEAMISERADRSRLTPSEAIEELTHHAGTYYSPEIIEVLRKHLEARGDIPRECGTAA